jgi:tight adherence protein B
VLLHIAIIVFLAVFCAILALYLSMQGKLDWRSRATRQRLGELSGETVTAAAQVSILRGEEKLSSIPWMDRVLRRLSLSENLRRLIIQSGSKVTAGVVVLTMASLGLLTAVLVQSFTHNLFLALVVAPGPAVLPWLHLAYKRSKRLRAFEEQLPEALDMIVNALRSGFTFELALKMVAQEHDDPLAFEFATVFEQQQLGVPLDEALSGLRYRVPNEDLDVLIIALILNRRTGGNLAEVLEKAASTIRDRFRLKREVRTKSAHGRFSGFVLIALPLGMAAIMTILAPEYIMSMLKDNVGQWLLGTAVVMQIIGILVIRKIINIQI